ncbi:MAG: hypothetical protein HY716_04805 [Planctomycetes bacterium]|nr:hypothetical protein [Planctomycetota bacterium]
MKAKRNLLIWGIVIGVLAAAVGSYIGVPSIRRAVDRMASTFGLAGPKEGVTYWCPMHPEIVRKNPGTCPV